MLVYKKCQQGNEIKFFFNKQTQEFWVEQTIYDSGMKEVIKSDQVVFSFDDLISALCRLEQDARDKNACEK